MAVWKRSIARRLLLSFLGTVILAMGVVGVAMSYLVQHYIYHTERMELVRKAKRINLAIQDSSKVSDELVSLLVFLDQTFDARIWLFDTHGRIVATSTRDEVFIGKSVANSVVEKVRRGEPVISPLGIEGLNEPMLSVAVPWGKGNRIYGGIVLHAPVKGINDAVSRVRETMAWALALGVVAATLLASYLSWSIARLLKEMERMAAELRQGRYDRRLSVHRDDEVGDLARTFNELAERLEASERERKRLDRLRDELLANLSHELRTPLTSMQGFLEALQDGLVEDEELRQKYYRLMAHETAHMSRLIDDMLDLAKLQTHAIRLNREAVDVKELLAFVAMTFEPEARDKGTAIVLDVPDELPPVYGDSVRVEQMLNNLVSNAVKFTENGRITLRAWAEGSGVCIEVADTGVGIAAEDLPRIFERFFKVDRHRTKKNRGSGLGLAIVKELVELHGGRIEVQSQLGQGTTFRLWLPAVP